MIVITLCYIDCVTSVFKLPFMKTHAYFSVNSPGNVEMWAEIREKRKRMYLLCKLILPLLLRVNEYNHQFLHIYIVCCTVGQDYWP